VVAGGRRGEDDRNTIHWLRWAPDEAVLNVVHKKQANLAALTKKIKAINAQVAVLTSDKYCK
jgi:hypothetical protein